VSNTRPADAPLSSLITRSLTMCPKTESCSDESFCNGLRLHGIEREEKQNASHETVISTAASRSAVRVIRTDEEYMIAKAVCSFLVFDETGELSHENEHTHA